MAAHAGPNIIENGLVTHLDASNVKSYPGSGTTWTDLVDTRNYSMYGTVPFSSDAGGCWDFSSMATGTSGSSPLGFTTSGGIPFSSTSSFTVSAWIYQTTNTGQTGLYSNASGGDGVRFGPSNGGIYYLIGPSYKEGVIGSSSFNLNEWAMITAVYDRASELSGSPVVYAYVNGESVGSVTQSTQTSMTSSTPGIVRSSCCTRFIGKLAMLSVHNFALTADQVYTNFLATRGRFGL